MNTLKEVLDKINFHIIFAVSVIVIIALVCFRLNAWNNRSIIIDDDDGTSTEFDTERLDNYVPYTYENASPKAAEDMVIACFGNAPFTDSKNTSAGLANLIEAKTGATVYNFGFENSYLSCKNAVLQPNSNDLFSLYWLTTIFAINNDTIVDEYLAANPNTSLERKATLSLLQNLDFNTVDVVAIMYDGSDYLDERGMYNRDDSQNICHFAGALQASIELMKEYYPHLEVIVLSAPYAYGLEADGSYVDSTLKTYGQEGPLASYVQYESEACYNTYTTFIDTFYGSVSYYTADTLLEDHIHLTDQARELLAEDFMKGFNYYLKYRNKDN